MVFYFSGTGNSQLAAKLIAQELGDEIISMNEEIKSGKKGMFHSKQPLVFVVPTYAWQMPKVVEAWIRETRFEENPNAYFVLTCGGSVGNAASYAKKLCQDTGLCFCGLALVAMPNNYVALSNPPDKAECAQSLKKARERVSLLAAIIQRGELFPEASVSMKDRMNSGPVNGLFYALFVRDKGFHSTNACISCGKCAKRCPLNNIDMVNGKPVWNGRCTHCMACIGGCPAEAIEYKSISKGKRRYYIMKE